MRMDRLMHSLTVSLAAVVLFGVMVSPAAAKLSETGWYVGGGWGITDIDEDGVENQFEDASGMATTSFDVDDDDDAWRILAGYQFLPQLAGELSYVDLGEYDFDGSTSMGTFTGEQEIDGLAANLVGRKFLTESVYGFAKAGVFRWQSSLESSAGSRDDHGGDFTWGLGLGYEHKTSGMGIRAGWDRYKVEDSDVDVVSANLVYRFRTHKREPKREPAPAVDRNRMQELEQQLAQKKQRVQTLEQRLAQLKQKFEGMEVQNGKKQVTLILPNRVLFATGRAQISEEGRRTLSEIASTLKDHPNRPVRVEGHTDTVPINTARFASNWELSAARATNVVKYLVDQEGVDAGRVAAVARGEHDPRVPNTSPENRRKNRRVEIIILPGDRSPETME